MNMCFIVTVLVKNCYASVFARYHTFAFSYELHFFSFLVVMTLVDLMTHKDNHYMHVPSDPIIFFTDPRVDALIGVPPAGGPQANDQVPDHVSDQVVHRPHCLNGSKLAIYHTPTNFELLMYL